ncbi:MAG: MtnX-like HAD-IB family phosphatase [Bacteroidota bacterium]
MTPVLNIFTDFDGTITLEDVGDAMFERFGGLRCHDYIEQYRIGLISAAECFRLESLACGEVNQKELNSFLDEQKIDPAFASFVDFCKHKKFPLSIFSDGMDYYIRRILENANLGHVPFYSNTLRLLPVEGRSTVEFKPEFPHLSETCDRCACCKRNIMLTHSGDDDILVCIGEGYSDRCPAKYADILFAKDALAAYCAAEGLPFYEYKTFADIAARLKELLKIHETNPGKTRLHKRRQAELARRDVFIGE